MLSLAAIAPPLAHGFEGAAGGVSAVLYLAAAMSAFVFLESRDASRTAATRSPMRRRTKIAGAVCIVTLVAGVTAPWWVPHSEGRRAVALTTNR